MAWTTPETFTAGQTLTAASMNAISGNDAMLADIGNRNAWTAWTPTWTGLTVGNATQDSAYMRVGRLIVARLSITFGSTSSFSGAFTATLPVAANAAFVDFFSVGTALLKDADSSFKLGHVLMASTTAVKFTSFNVNATTRALYNAVSNTDPMTWTTNDAIFASFSYEAAS